MSKSTSKKKQSIENAEVVIERFGGIRPMAKKMDVAVTTVQGWKKRGVIPGTRTKQLMKAANDHDIDLADVLPDAAPKAEKSAGPSAKTKAAGTKAKETQALAAPAKKAKQDEFSSRQKSPIAPESFDEKLIETEYKAVAKSTWITVAVVLIALAIAAFFLFPLNNQAPQSIQNEQRLGSLERDIDALRGDVGEIKDQQSFFTTMIPEDLDERIAKIQEQARGAQDGVSMALKKAEAVSAEIMSAQSLSERINKLEGFVYDISQSPKMEMFFTRLQTLTRSMSGQVQIDQTILEINTALASLQDTTDVSVNEALERVRATNEASGKTLQGIPAQDLKAAALLLGMTQFRESLNRDNAAFNDDLTLLMNLVGEENPELNEALARLAPQAQSGVLTPSGLTREFKTIAGDVVVESLKGEDVSFMDKMKARMNEVLSIQKDGELVTGTDTQAALLQTEKLLADGNIDAAIQTVSTLDGPEAQALEPWIRKARATQYAREIEAFIDRNLQALAAGEMPSVLPSGRLVRDPASGSVILKP